MIPPADAAAPPHLVVVAPFWGATAHVGVYRVDRFARWARAAGARVTIVRAGSADRTEPGPYGPEVVVADPIRFYRDPGPASAGGGPPRRENALRRAVATTVLSPDPGVAWARRAASHPAVLAQARGARWVLSSSPPESSHLCAWRLARAVGAHLVADLRDGWLDDPLKPALLRHRVRRWHEGYWERRVVRDAAHVFVTSSVWRDMLLARYPAASPRTVVLTNGYPPAGVRDGGGAGTAGATDRDESTRAWGGASRDVPPRQGTAGTVRLLHAGRFTTSRQSQTVERLLSPLLAGIRELEQAGRARAGRVSLLGDLGPADLTAVEGLRPAFAACNWALEPVNRVPRAEALRALASADGLLLLSATPPTIPSKLFEYLPARRPILAVTPTGGAVWRACADLPQVTLVEPDDAARAAAGVARFLDECVRAEPAVVVPEQFAESALERVFLDALRLSRPAPADGGP